MKIKQIQEVVAEWYNISVSEMTSDRSSKAVSRPRQVAMYLSRELTGQSLPAIGRMFNRTHTTVMYAIAAIEKRKQHDVKLNMALEWLRTRLSIEDAA